MKNLASEKYFIKKKLAHSGTMNKTKQTNLFNRNILVFHGIPLEKNIYE
jgi:hypothetical protein